jgi:hypothetical protein
MSLPQVLLDDEHLGENHFPLDQCRGLYGYGIFSFCPAKGEVSPVLF